MEKTNNKNIFYASALITFIIVSGAAIFVVEKYTQPLTIIYTIECAPMVLNNSYLAQESDVIVIGDGELLHAYAWSFLLHSLNHRSQVHKPFPS
ncbi:MAG: hypothetical protein JXA38_01715, partial [Methanosarcinaceae archaeon]|nr:hypothetical protein [Methanosarcinaceae archaeon]